jgi:metallo-beta-lactamase family protein
MLDDLVTSGRLPQLPIYVDSPMAIDVTALYAAHRGEHDADMTAALAAGRDPLGAMGVTYTRTQQASKALNDLRGPVIIISASGMATGGRILHHLAHRLDDSRTTVLLVGFQAPGTRGRALKEGARQVRVFGREVAVRARIETIDALSAHADRSELLRWIGALERPPRTAYLVHGEPGPAASLAAALEERGWSARPARHEETVSLDP